MVRYIYKITFLKGNHTGHYYIGQHSTENINDGYLASGLFPVRYFKKYGTIEGETYIREIVEQCDSLESLNEAERRWINTSDPLCTNVALGGENNGGWNKGKTLTPEWKAKISATLKGHPGAGKGQKRPKEVVEKISAANRGKKRTLEQRQKMSEAKKGKKQGPRSEEVRQKIAEFNRQKAKDPVYKEHLREGLKRRWQNYPEEKKRAHAEHMRQVNLGKTHIYMTDGTTNKYVQPDKVQEWLDKGWFYGRIWKGKLHIHEPKKKT